MKINIENMQTLIKLLKDLNTNMEEMNILLSQVKMKLKVNTDTLKRYRR